MHFSHFLLSFDSWVTGGCVKFNVAVHFQGIFLGTFPLSHIFIQIRFVSPAGRSIPTDFENVRVNVNILKSAAVARWVLKVLVWRYSFRLQDLN